MINLEFNVYYAKSDSANCISRRGLPTAYKPGGDRSLNCSITRPLSVCTELLRDESGRRMDGLRTGHGPTAIGCGMPPISSTAEPCVLEHRAVAPQRGAESVR